MPKEFVDAESDKFLARCGRAAFAATLAVPRTFLRPHQQKQAMSAIRIACLVFTALMLASAAAAQSYPAKPVRLVVPYPPGGSNDVLSRITAQAMTPGLSVIAS